jgi:hypothetical protein
MGEKRFGFVLVAAGAALLALTLLADPLGIEGAHGFGWKQTVGVIVGGVLIVLGFGVATLARRRRSYTADPTRQD